MKYQVLASNVAQVSLSDGTEVLYSYQTAVAIFIPGRGWIRDGHYFSRTTSRHINAYTGSAGNADRAAAMVTHEEFMRLIESVTLA